MTRRERVWRLVPAVFFMIAFNKSSNQRVESDRCGRRTPPPVLVVRVDFGLVRGKVSGCLERSCPSRYARRILQAGAMDLVYAVL